MIFDSDYANRFSIFETIFMKCCRLEIMAFPSTEIVFSIPAAFSVSDLLMHICSNSLSCHNLERVHATLFHQV